MAGQFNYAGAGGSMLVAGLKIFNTKMRRKIQYALLVVFSVHLTDDEFCGIRNSFSSGENYTESVL